MDGVLQRDEPLDIDQIEEWGGIADGGDLLQAIIDAVADHAEQMYALPVEYPPAVRLALTMQVVRIWERRPEGDATTGDDCTPPPNVTSVTRQGVSYQMADPAAIVGRIEFDADTEVLLAPYRRFCAA